MLRVRAERTVSEYRKVLRNGIVDGKVDPGVATWGRSARVVLRAAINWAVEVGELKPEEGQALIASIPFEVRKPKHRVRRLSGEERKKLFDILAQEDSTVALLVRFSMGLGFRSEEALGMKRCQLEAAVTSGQVVFKRKGNKTEALEIGDRKETFQKLLAIEGWKVVGDIICKGHLESKKAVWRKLLREWGKKHGIDTHPHALRHAFAQEMYDHGADIVEIQTWLSHESIETTRGYLEGRTDSRKLFKLGGPNGRREEAGSGAEGGK